MLLPWLFRTGGAGRDCTETRKVTGTAAPEAKVPKLIPVSGESAGLATPLTVTLPETKVLPEGILSLRVTAAPIFPEF